MRFKLTVEQIRAKEALITGLRDKRLPWFNYWRELADYFVPKKYVWLLNENETRRRASKNSYILDPTGTHAARTLAAGMMNGITSPTRPWFKLRVSGASDEDPQTSIWLDEVERRMLFILATSNFYNAIAVMYLDLVIFGTAAMLVYEDYDSVIHCYNPSMGEFFLQQDSRQYVGTFAREFNYTVQQTVERFGIENCSDRVQTAYKAGKARLLETVKIYHLIEPNTDKQGNFPERMKYREFYWEMGKDKILGSGGYSDIPGIFPRWETTANDTYGQSPAMDALPDVIQLQHETKKKAQALDKLVSPPVVADIQLSRKPTSLLPNGVTYIAGANGVGVKPVYQINPPLGEMTADIQNIQHRIRETLHNPLFNMISQLDTVRSATEIDARREEKLILLGPVLERFQHEGLDPVLNRVYGIMERGGLLPPPPPQMQGQELEIQYISILSAAQSAVATAPTERFLQITGNLAAIVPQVLDIPNFDELLLDYAKAIGVPAKGINAREQIAASREQREAPAIAQQAVESGSQLAQAAQQLSDTDTGGGANLLQQLLGGA